MAKNSKNKKDKQLVTKIPQGVSVGGEVLDTVGKLESAITNLGSKIKRGDEYNAARGMTVPGAGRERRRREMFSSILQRESTYHD